MQFSNEYSILRYNSRSLFLFFIIMLNEILFQPLYVGCERFNCNIKLYDTSKHYYLLHVRKQKSENINVNYHLQPKYL